jgi:hypothetical protein
MDPDTARLGIAAGPQGPGLGVLCCPADDVHASYLCDSGLSQGVHHLQGVILLECDGEGKFAEM